VALVVTQLRASEPLLNLRLLADRLFRSMTATMSLTMAAFLGLLFLAALFLQDGLGLSPPSPGSRHGKPGARRRSSPPCGSSAAPSASRR
jgi:hypothetical protein